MGAWLKINVVLAKSRKRIKNKQFQFSPVCKRFTQTLHFDKSRRQQIGLELIINVVLEYLILDPTKILIREPGMGTYLLPCSCLTYLYL